MTVKLCQRENFNQEIVASDYRAKYCSKSCAAQVNNRKFPKRQKSTEPLNTCHCGAHIRKTSKQCLNCYLRIAKPPAYTGGPRKRSYEEKECLNCFTLFNPRQGVEKCCSKQCSSVYSIKLKAEIKIQQWVEGNWTGGSESGLSKTIRKYLLEKSDYACSKCGFNTNHPDDGKSILEINHINGDGTDHRPCNLEVLCPNCHALTSSYRGRNLGRGRPTYYLRVSK